MERGKRGTTFSTLHKLSDVFGEPIDSFFKHTEETSYTESQKLREKVGSLITCFSSAELGLVIHMVKGIQRMRGNIEDND